MSAPEHKATRLATPRAHRIVLYSHDSQGLGHLRRNLSLAHRLASELPALTGQPVTGLLVCGIEPVPGFALPEAFDWLILPGITKASIDAADTNTCPADSTATSGMATQTPTTPTYQARHLGVDMDTLVRMRSAMLDAALTHFQPDLLIVDRHIYGVGQELREPLLNLRKNVPHCQVVLGLREVLDSAKKCNREWEALGSAHQLRQLVDAVWIYGDPTVHDVRKTGEIPWFLHDRCAFTGYLATGRNLGDEPGRLRSPFVLTTVGGGQDGARLLTHAARLNISDTHEHLIVTGPQLDDAAFAALGRHSAPRTRIVRSLPGLGDLIRHADAVIAMGGYNTVTEILATDTPALVVPRVAPRREQLIRARALATRGAIDCLLPAEVTHGALQGWVASTIRAHNRPRQAACRAGIDRDGLRNVAHRAAKLLARAASPATPEMKEVQ